MEVKKYGDVKRNLNTHFIIKTELDPGWRHAPRVQRVVCSTSAQGTNYAPIAPNGIVDEIADDTEVVIVSV